ncbi:MAG TPA: immunoglobulin domain-containing protein [Gemmataceae bacterium]|jgi:hypothetical protein
MFHSPWLCKWLNMARSRKDRRQRTRNRKTVHLLLESLEERLTPSGPQTVGSYTDLVNAIAADTGSNTNYDIQITQSFQFNSGSQVVISNLGTGSTLTIEGQNGTNHTLTGNGNRLFTVAPGQNVTFKNLTLTGGGGVTNGGAILDTGGDVTLSNVIVEGNSVTGAQALGGGLFVSGSGNLTIQAGSTIESNSALGTGNGSFAQGGGVYANSTTNGLNLVITDSTIRNNTAKGSSGTDGAAPGAVGGNGGEAAGGGVFVTGSGWNAKLLGDTFLGNSVIGGNGGKGAAGSNATAANTSGGNGGAGGQGGDAIGGAGEFLASSPSGQSSGTLTILNDASNPSKMIDNSAQGGSGGNGGNGGASTGTANNTDGGAGGIVFNAFGGALDVESNPSGTVTVNIGNTTFYGNAVTGGNGGTGGAAGTGGSGAAGTAGTNQLEGPANGGAIDLGEVGGTFTMVNSTVAKNTAKAGLPGGSDVQSTAEAGGGIYDNSIATVILDNNTITQNSVSTTSSSPGAGGAGILVETGNPTLLNNLIQGNQGIGESAPDLTVVFVTTPLSNATSNFIASMSTKAVDITTNIVGNGQTQLGSVVGVDSNGNPTGGPIYYPLLDNTVSIGAGMTSVLSTIANVEGTTSAAAADEIGNPRSSNNSIDLGAVQFQSPSAPAITVNPSNQITPAGSNVSFTATASGFPVPTVQWQVSTDGGKTFSNISGATSTTLTLSNVQASQNGEEYQAVFTNSNGSATTTAASLTVQFAPTVTSNPANQTVTAGSTATFTASASGMPLPTVQWQESSDGGKTFSNIDGATSPTLTLSNVQVSQNGHEYRAVFTNSIGTVTSTAATLTVQTAPAFTSANNASFTVGQSGSFLVKTSGSPAPTLTASGALPSGVTFTDNGNGTATLVGAPAAGTQGTYQFTITASNGVGSAVMQNFTLTVNPASVPPSSSQPPALQVPPLLALINEFLKWAETINADGTETVTYGLFGFTLITATYDSSGNFVSGNVFGFTIPNSVWFM